MWRRTKDVLRRVNRQLSSAEIVPDKTVAHLFHTMTAANGSDAHTGVVRINVKDTRSGLIYKNWITFVSSFAGYTAKVPAVVLRGPTPRPPVVYSLRRRWSIHCFCYERPYSHPHDRT